MIKMMNSTESRGTQSIDRTVGVLKHVVANGSHGLTVADLSPTIRPVVMSLQHVAARQELRALRGALGVSGLDDSERSAAE